ncbi:MAG: PEGA domain-containing protein [candidate division Zixibacteria bacterium]
MGLKVMSIRLLLWIWLALSIGSATAQTQDSTAVVRIRVDIDSVSISMNDSPITVDSYGNQLTANAWFILNVDPGSYRFRFIHRENDLIDRNLTAVLGEVATIDLTYIEPIIPTDTLPVAGTGSVRLLSVPDSSTIMLDQELLAQPTPTLTILSSGKHSLEILREGFEPIEHSLELEPDSTVSLIFKLRPLPPPKPSAEELGMAYEIETPLQDEALADEQMKKYVALTETFAIIPLAQGVLAKLTLDEDSKEAADILIISGTVLTAGSYLLGKFLSKRKRRQIITYNERTSAANIQAAERNALVDIAIRETHAETLKTWREETKGKGVVEVVSGNVSRATPPPDNPAAARDSITVGSAQELPDENPSADDPND